MVQLLGVLVNPFWDRSRIYDRPTTDAERDALIEARYFSPPASPLAVHTRLLVARVREWRDRVIVPPNTAVLTGGFTAPETDPARALFPRWTTDQAIEAAREIEERLRGEGYRRLLKQLFGNKPDLWNPKLRGIDRLRASINVFTRMRYCDVRGRIAFGEKGAPGTQRPGLYPWYEVPGQHKRDLRIVCGHWSTLGRFAGLGICMIDTGCVWGGWLTALKLDAAEPEFVSIKSDRKPAAGKDVD